MIFRNFVSTIVILIVYFITKFISKDIANNYHSVYYKKYDAIISTLFSWTKISIGDYIYALVGCILLYILIYYLIKRNFLYSIKFLINSILLFLIVFQWSWGINNYKTPLYQTLKISNDYTNEDLYQYAEKYLKELNALHSLITTDENQPIIIEKDYDYFYKEAISNLKKIWFLKHYNIDILTPAKPSLYSFALSKSGFSGYFNPFTHENQINDQVPTIGMPVTYIHELSHQLGFASESEANFIAYFALKKSNDLSIKYAAELYAFKYIMKEIGKINEEKYWLLRSSLRPGIEKNIRETEDFWQKNKNFSSNIFKPLYGMFLKTNNQKHGLKSYNLMVNLVINYDKKYANFIP